MAECLEKAIESCLTAQAMIDISAEHLVSFFQFHSNMSHVFLNRLVSELNVQRHQNLLDRRLEPLKSN